MNTNTENQPEDKKPDSKANAVGCSDLLAHTQPETTPEEWKGKHPSLCHIPIKPMLWNHNEGKCYAGEVVWYDENGWIHGTPAWLTRAFAGRFYGDSLMSLGDKLLLIGGDESTLTFVPRGSWIAQEVSIRAIDPLTFNTKFYGTHIRETDTHHNFMVRGEDLVMECNAFS